MTINQVDIHTHNPTSESLTLSSYGVHPRCAGEVLRPLSMADFEVKDAVGEIGLDYACAVDRELQQQLFEEQLQIAEELGKIVVVHCVRAYNEVLATLRKYNLRRVIFHGFIGSVQLAEQLFERGYWLSFGGRTFSSPKTIEALRATPLNRLFLESDQGEVDIQYMYGKVAEILNLSEEELSAQIYENYKHIIE